MQPWRRSLGLGIKRDLLRIIKNYFGALKDAGALSGAVELVKLWAALGQLAGRQTSTTVSLGAQESAVLLIKYHWKRVLELLRVR